MTKQRFVWILGIFFIIIMVISIFAKPIIIYLVMRQLKNVFIDSDVSIGGCDFQPLKLVGFSGIKIEKANFYDIKLKELRFHYSLPALFRGVMLRVYLQDARLDINLPQKKLFELTRFINLKPKKTFSPGTVELSRFNINLKAKDLSLVTSVSASFDLRQSLLNYLNLKISSLDVQNFRLKNAALELDWEKSTNKFYIKQITYDKLKLKGIRGKVDLSGKILYLNFYSAQLQEGKLQGELKVLLERAPEYTFEFKVEDLGLLSLIRDFNLSEKFQMSGNLNGNVKLMGKAMSLNLLEGNFSLPQPGGMLNITDKRLLEKIAKANRQPLDAIVKGFRSYQYNTGVMRLSLDNGNLILNVGLDGDSGKRKFEIILHDFKIGKEGPL